MILRGHRTQRMADASMFELATMAHEAEESDDDLTSIGLMEELEVRKARGDDTEKFRRFYIEQWPQRQKRTSFNADESHG
jgi:hypothetical protein